MSVSIIARNIGGLTFDATFEETHTADLEVTDNPIETGASVTDHSFLKPFKVRICAGVSNSQLKPGTDEYGFGNERIRNAYEALLDLQATREPFDVQTGLKLYSNMICTSIVVPQDKESANAIIFTAELREVIIVYTATVTYPPRAAGKTANQAGKTKDKGEKQGTEAAAPVKQSGLKRLASAIGKG